MNSLPASGDSSKHRPCPCGHAPALTEGQKEVFGQIIYTMRLECACGKQGALLFYTKPEQRGITQQVAWDGWNLAGSQ